MTKIGDVAKLARVSKGTVSNVFSQKRPTSKEVRQRVMDASRELNYVPNHIARSLVTKRTMAIGLTIPHGNFFFSNFHNHFLNGVIMEAANYGYKVLLDTIPLQKIKTSFLSSYPIDGAIIMRPTENDERIDLMQHAQTPFVVIGKVMNANMNNIQCVNNDNEQISYDISKYLFNKGHSNIVFFNTTESMTVSIERKVGFLKAMKEQKIKVESYMLHHKPDVDSSGYLEYGFEQTKQIIGSLNRKVTAIIADDERTAFSVIRALKELNLSVPEDISIFVIAGDNSLMDQSDPPLTCMDLQPSELGVQSVRMLMKQIEGNQTDAPETVIIEGKVIERNSCHSI